MKPVLVHATLDERERSGRIEVKVGFQLRTIFVTRRALLTIASPPRATESRLLQYAATFSDIALCQSQETDARHILLVTATDVLNWKRGWAPCQPPLKLAAYGNAARAAKAIPHLRLVWNDGKAI